jgi:TonB family protein
VDFTSAHPGSKVDPAMPTSLDPAESLAPSPTPAPKAPAADPDDVGGSIAVPVLSPGMLAAAGNRPLPYGEGMSRPEQLDGKEIAYTREALAAKVQGTMLVRCTITREGRVENCRTLKSVPHMEETVLEALQSRRYKPILYKGQVVAVDYVFNVKLQLPRH